MRDYRNLVFSVLDSVKIFSDDSVWETDHIVSILNKYRGLLFTQKYKGKKVEIPFAYYQRLNVYFDTQYNNGLIYKSMERIPNVLDTTNLWQYTFVHNDGMRSQNLNLINPQRFKMVGFNKWINNQIYVTIDADNYMYIKSPLDNASNQVALVGEPNTQTSNLEFIFLSEDELSVLTSEDLKDSYVYYDTILDNPIDGYRFNKNDSIDVLDFIFPCEESLIQPIIDLCIKELAAINNQLRDVSNNASDDFSIPKQQQ